MISQNVSVKEVVGFAMYFSW